MKTFKLALLMILISTTGLYAQTAYNPFTQNINFQPEPTVAGFECGSTPNVEFTQGMTTSADATQWQTQPLIVTICVTGFEFNGTTAAAVVSGSYSTNFSWAFDSFAPNCLIGTQSQTIVGTGSNPLSPNPAASGEINVALSVPETSPVSTVLAVNVNLQVPGYMAQFNSGPDDNESTQTQTFCSLKIKGTVFRDNLPDTDVNGTPVDSGVTTPILCANLIDPVTGNVVATSPVTSNGTYEFSNVTPNTVYDVRLTENCGIVGQPGPTSSLPPGWDNTGEDGDGDGVGTDGGTPDGTTTVSVGNATVENVNFGIDAALPVRMGHFTVSEYNCTALVAWATLSEENVSHFEILRKKPGSTQFTKIGKVDAAGNSSSQKLYSFVDKEVEKSTEPYTYQIKTIDIDRSESFSDSRNLKLTCGGDEVSVQLFPNPATDNINLVYTTNENDIQLNVDLLDIAGRKIMSKSQIILKGTSVINMDVKSLAVGQYMIRYHNVEGNSTETLKFTKE